MVGSLHSGCWCCACDGGDEDGGDEDGMEERVKVDSRGDAPSTRGTVVTAGTVWECVRVYN